MSGTDHEIKVPPDKGEQDEQLKQTDSGSIDMHLPTQEGANQNTKCEPSIGAPKLPNFQIGNLHVNILNKAYDSPEEDQERPGSPSTPFLVKHLGKLPPKQGGKHKSF
ncbi:hypothetical protein JTB14_028626 [Gonioctena quinquepunctata]|nr:hypothetical protein JTB14_028626 [Gonioctena quinquepunctata]